MNKLIAELVGRHNTLSIRFDEGQFVATLGTCVYTAVAMGETPKKALKQLREIVRQPKTLLQLFEDGDL